MNHSLTQFDFLFAYSQTKLHFENKIYSFGGRIHRIMHTARESFIESSIIIPRLHKEHHELQKYTYMQIFHMQHL